MNHLTKLNRFHRPLIQFILCLLLITPFTLYAEQESVWQKQEYKIKGEWSIETRDDGQYIVLDEDFKTKKGPDLKIYLSTTEVDKLSDINITPSSIKISPLQSHKGYQEYKIPQEINLDEFNSLVIHCEKYSHLWGGADLKK